MNLPQWGLTSEDRQFVHHFFSFVLFPRVAFNHISRTTDMQCLSFTFQCLVHVCVLVIQVILYTRKSSQYAVVIVLCFYSLKHCDTASIRGESSDHGNMHIFDGPHKYNTKQDTETFTHLTSFLKNQVLYMYLDYSTTQGANL